MHKVSQDACPSVLRYFFCAFFVYTFSIIYTDTESMSVHLINRTLFLKEYKNTSDRIEIYDSVQFCIAIICEKH